MIDERVSGGTRSALEKAANASAASESASPAASDSAPAQDARRAGVTAIHLSKSDIAALIERNYVGLRILIVRRCRDPDVAAELLNEAVCTAWAKWQAGKIERPDQIAGYVLQVAMNLLRNRRRAAAEQPERRADLGSLDELQGPGEPDEQTIEREIALRVKNVIRGMSSPRDRSILVRFYLDEEEKETICKDLGLSALQFDKILHRARGRLRKLLESGGFGGSDLLCLFPFL
jgi:RNA polymerase sigma-70 factor, ECF subfamily